MRFRCVCCGQFVEEVRDIVMEVNIDGMPVVIANLTGERCPSCGEEYLDPASSDLCEMIVKKYRERRRRRLYHRRLRHMRRRV